MEYFFASDARYAELKINVQQLDIVQIQSLYYRIAACNLIWRVLVKETAKFNLNIYTHCMKQWLVFRN